MRNGTAPAFPLPSTGLEETEVSRTLLAETRGQFGPIPGALIVRTAIAAAAGGDFPVQRAALDALSRRWTAFRRDSLQIRERPPGKKIVGLYGVGRAESRSIRSRVLLASLEPLRSSCGCRDFVRGSLGICKHVFAVVDGWFRAGAPVPTAPGSIVPRLSWDPIRPLAGPGDWLDRLRWTDAAVHPVEGLAEAAARRRFLPGRGPRPLVTTHAGSPIARQKLIASLLTLGRSPEPRGTIWADPAVVTLLESEQLSIERIRDARSNPRRLRSSLRSLKQRLFPYQQEGVSRFFDTGRLLLADDMGLGKTAQAIAAAHALFSTGRVKHGLVIVPASLKPQWLREWQLFSDVPFTAVEGDAAARANLYRGWRRGFLLTNYEQVLRDLEHVLHLAPDLVVLDEAQRLKNWATKTATSVKQLSPRWRLVLTGTPLENRLEELASITEWVDDFALEPKWRLGPVHAIHVDGTHDVVGARHLETLRARLAPSMLRRVRADVLGQLPPRRDVRVPVALTPEQKTAHDELVLPIARLVSIARKRPLLQAEFLRLMSLLTRQRILCNGLAQRDFEETWPTLEAAGAPTEALLHGLCSPKLLELREILSSLVTAQGRKVVVFSQWRRMLRLAQWATCDVLEGAGIRSGFFTGEEGLRRRTQNLVDFHDDPRMRVLFATDAGGVGLNLQRAASACVNLDLPWNPAVLEQRIGRIYRLGQTQPVDVYNLVSEGGIESRIASVVSDKQVLFRGLFDGSSDEVQFARSGSFLAGVERLIEPGVVAARQADEGEPPDEEPLGEAEVDSAPTPDRSPEPSSPVAPDALADLFARIRVTATEDGRVVFEAPRDAAVALASVLTGVAKLLAPSGAPRPTE